MFAGLIERTMSGAAAAAAAVPVTPTYRTGDSVTGITAASYDFTGITTYAGLRHVILLSVYAYTGAPTLTLGGDAMTSRALIETSNLGVYAYDVVPSSAGAGKTLTVTSTFAASSINFDLLTIPGSGNYSSNASKGFDFVADPQVATGNLTVPASGCGMVSVFTSGGPISPNTGLTEEAERSGVGVYTMSATGLPSVNVGGAAGTMLLAVSYG